ncbi:hypothetical protein E2C01_055223 [Portunus trituberculatus]|uniref:Uncharacterized protein n=1 Tax=Portunus trituberculatus TaxID=210409 RepID=A0A5B7GVD5_PORTR|nr:hypothetical protein [Portunus trituberculatus]
MACASRPLPWRNNSRDARQRKQVQLTKVGRVTLACPGRRFPCCLPTRSALTGPCCSRDSARDRMQAAGARVSPSTSKLDLSQVPQNYNRFCEGRDGGDGGGVLYMPVPVLVGVFSCVLVVQVVVVAVIMKTCVPAVVFGVPMVV